MEIERTCVVCSEDANYFCRICSTHYCPDHLCLHLSVAWESNTWTNRNKGEWNDWDERDIRDERTATSETYEIRTECEVQKEVRNLLPYTPKLVGTYTETQLHAAYQFYLSQARRIRAELDRRAVLIEGAPCKESYMVRTNEYKATKQRQKPRVSISRSVKRSVDVLLNNLRTGTISLEQVTARIRAASATK